MNDYQLSRKMYFDEAMARTGFQSDEPLTASYKIPAQLYTQLQNHVSEYLSISAGVTDWSDIDSGQFLGEVLRKAKNLSTSGIVIPKSYCDQKFTQVHKLIAEILTQSKISNVVDFWIYPFNVRLKGIDKTAKSLSYPTELPHSETWVGCSARSVLLHIPVLGDMEGNRLKVWRPNNEMGSEWMKPLGSYHDANELIANSQELPVTSAPGTILMVDSSLLHGTHRTENAGLRVSIDLNLVLKSYPEDVFPDGFNLLADRQKVSNQHFFEIGKTLRVQSPDGEDDIFLPVDGMRHPANIKITKI
ncbi:hypothetical protein [Bdellovibrio sp. GT3]|uniref:hypothetical protein n=1 Tax=Bdellovibrio sp. GT3 TaxID=3136282 RepID=UPI0030EFBE4B